MKNLQSLIRHWLTALAGIGTLLSVHAIIPSEATEQANAAGTLLVEPLAVLAGLVAASVVRILISAAGRVFPRAAGWLERLSGELFRLPLWILGIAMAGLIGGLALPSCASIPRGVPVEVFYHGKFGEARYSAKGAEVRIEELQANK
jgi:hypothetical protein